MTRIAALLLAAFLTGCATYTNPPPSEMLLPCPHPVVEVKTNGDLAKGLLAYRSSLDACNLQIDTLRQRFK